MKRIVIFDLDGTLLNTIGDLAHSCNTVLKRHSLPTYTYDEYRWFVGNGVMRLVERAIPEPLRTEERVAALRAEFVEYYHANNAQYTTPYEGITELLESLQEQRVAVAVASNKYQEGTRKLVSHYFPEIYFCEVLGQQEGLPLKPNPQIIYNIEELRGYRADEVLYVGDSGIDMETARAAKVESVGVAWGFRSIEELQESGADHIVHTPAEILQLIK